MRYVVEDTETQRNVLVGHCDWCGDDGLPLHHIGSWINGDKGNLDLCDECILEYWSGGVIVEK